MMATILGEFAFAAGKEQVGKARRMVVVIASSYDGVTLAALEEVELLTNELVTNSIVHTATPTVSVQVAVDEPRRLLRVVVWDDGSGGPVAIPDADLANAGLLSEHGRGLSLLRMLAADCGVESDGYGSAVWFELKL
jgi:anti-sigma regulatory factor (Ser/Thr protein kinase)